MDWIQFAIFLTTIGGMFAWLRSDIALNRSEAAADRRDMAADRRDMLNIVRSIQEEMKDFHGRLCAIEERNKGK